jgi:hypothetical protein
LFSKSRVPTLEPTVLWLTSQGATLQTESEVVSYGYPPLEKPSPGPNGFPTASLGVMKLSAIAKRGLRRDFWDLFVIVHDGGLTLDEILRAYRRRFDRGAADEYHLVRSLSYFVDAERDDPRVIGLAPHRWRAIKAFFESESRRLIAD